MPGMGPAGQPTGFLEGRVLRYSEIPFFSGSAMVRVIMLPSPMPSTTDLGITGNVKKFEKNSFIFMCQEHLLSVSGGLHPLEISLDSEVGDHQTILLPECADCLSATER